MEPQNQQVYSQVSGSSSPEHHASHRTGLIILTILSVLLLAGTIWAVASYLSVKSNIDAQVAQQIDEALAEQEAKLRAEFKAEQEATTKAYQAPDTYGSVNFKYPKSWSVYKQKGTDENPVSATLHPGVVDATTANYGLKINVYDRPYSEVMNGFQEKINEGLVTSKATKSNGVVGSRLSGAVTDDTRDDGIAVLFELRDKTLALWTESSEYKSVFEQAVKSLKFSP